MTVNIYKLNTKFISAYFGGIFPSLSNAWRETLGEILLIWIYEFTQPEGMSLAMKNIKWDSGFLNSSVALLGLLGGIVAFAMPTMAAVEGNSYDVRVQSSDRDRFDACFDFGQRNNLRIDGLGAVYDGTNLGRNNRNWQAVTRSSSVNVGFSGRSTANFQGRSGRISGNAINSNGTTFTFDGRIRRDPCPALRTRQTNPFLK